MARRPSPPRRSQPQGGVNISGAVGDVGRDIVGRDKVSSTVNNTTINNYCASDGAVGAGDQPVPEEVILAAMLVDRVPQRDALINRLEAGDAADGLAIVAVVQGCSLDMHQALVRRCARVEFVEHFGGAGAWRYLGRLPWPPDGRASVMGLLRDIRGKLSLAKDLDQAGIEQAVRGFPLNICLSHFIDEEAWAADGGALVREWIDYLGGNVLRPAPGCRLVAFVCIEQREPELEVSQNGFLRLLSRMGLFASGRKRAASDLEGFVDALRARFPPEQSASAHIIVPPQLGLIDRGDVGEWISCAGEYLRNPELESRLMLLPGRIFDGGETKRRFEQVFKALLPELGEALPPRRRFEELPS